MNKKSIGDFFKSNAWFIIGFVLISLFVFSNFLYGYKLSCTNLNYDMEPYNTYEVDTDGPWLSDVADSEYPLIYKVYYSDTGFSLWDSDLSIGSPSNAIAELSNPMKWVYLLPLDIACFLKSFSELAIAFFTMFLFMRSLDIRKYPAAIAGIIYAFSSVMTAWLGWPHSDVAAVAPLLFFAIEKLTNTIKIKYALLISLTVYVMLIVGMPTYAAYFLYLAGAYIVIFTIIKHWKNKKNIVIVAALFALSIILAALLSLPYTYTLMDSVVANGYADSRASQAEAYLDWDYLISFIFPNIRDGLEVHLNESTMFVGLVPVILVPISLFNSKNKKRNIFFIASSLIVGALIFTGIFNFIFTRLPLVNTSIKYRVIALLMFTLSALSGLTLNDLLNNKEYYKNKKWILALTLLWTAVIMYIASKDLIAVEEDIVITVIVLASALTLCISMFFLFKKNYKILLILFTMLLVLDNTRFIKEYLPWIDADVPVIPEASDSVTYLMDNTKENERIAGIGEWTLFPNSPSYYELDDVRIHGFISTNQDWVDYFTEIDDNAYTTRTRTCLTEIENYPLLQYLGVKYIYGAQLGDSIALGDTESNSSPLGLIPSYSVLSQNITLDKDAKLVQIRFATYDTIPESNSSLTLSVSKASDGSILAEKIVNVNNIRDNSYLLLPLDDVELSEDTECILTISFDDLKNDTLTVWTRSSNEHTLHYNNEELPLTMCVNIILSSDEYDISYCGEDYMLVAKLNGYSKKAELIESTYECKNQNIVLKNMKKEYLENTAFITDENSLEAYDIPLTENESVEILEYSDDYVKLSCDTDYSRYVSLNDYYHKDWSAYVNGKKVDIERINYLMRAVPVEAGDDIIVEFKYEPTKLYAVSIIAAVSLVLFIVLFLSRNKWQKILDKQTLIKP